MAQEQDTPSISVLPGEDAEDLQALIELFTAATGRAPTPAEIAEAQAELDSGD